MLKLTIKLGSIIVGTIIVNKINKMMNEYLAEQE